MKRIKVGLNGFGRIGRAFTRIALQRDTFDIVNINTRRTPNDMMAYLLKYDSVYRTFEKEVKATDDGLEIDGKKIMTSQTDDPSQIPWGDHGVDVVIDATGAFTKKPDLQKHMKDSVKKVILTAPSKDDETDHVVLGVNDSPDLFRQVDVCSNASCTTNCAAPLFKVLDDAFGVESGFLTTAHAYTQSQNLLDDANKKPDRSRAAPLNMIPSTTGAAKAVGKVIPHLKGMLDGMSIRVPVPTCSFTDITAIVKKDTTIEEVNAAFKKAAEGPMKGILAYATEVLVSSDYIGSTYSSIFDSNYTKVINGKLIKVYGWYDNEWGYSSRVVDLVEHMSEHV